MTAEMKVEERLNTLESHVAKQTKLFTDRQDTMNDLLSHAMTRMDNIEAPPATPDRSEIFTALAKAQNSIKNAEEDAAAEVQMKKGGKFSYSYATLASVLDAVRGPLSENGIALFQVTADPGQGMLGIKTVLAHESGQTISDTITMAIESHDPRGIGSIRTYMRRYAVLAICGIAGATDDDAEAAQPDPNDYPRISTSEVEKIIYHADELFAEHADDAVKLMLQRVFGGIAVIGDIREGEMQTALTYLDNAKEARDKREAKAKADEKAAAKAAKEEK